MPLLLGADNLAGTVELVRVTQREEGESKEPRARFNAADLKNDWQTWRDLKQNAAPHVYSPHYWRLYQETLLRYEQLLRAGDPTEQAAPLKKNLAELAVLIRAARTLDSALDCVGNSFPMPRALGFRPKVEIAEPVLRNYLARMKDEDLEKRKEARQPFADKSQFEKVYWQTRLSQLVLLKQLENEAFNGDQAGAQLAQILKDLDIAPQLAPEVQLVQMLNDADPAMEKKDNKVVATAVRVRMLAEEVALSMPAKADPAELYAEAIFQNFKAKVEAADETRRKGEDLLFGEPSVQAGKALEELTDARKRYDGIRLEAQQVREAYALRDAVAADLPFLATWLVHLPAVDNPAESEQEIQGLRQKVESLGNRLADLSSRLDRLDTPVADLAKLTAPLAADFVVVRDRSRQISEKLVRQQGGLQKNWHALEATLRVPPALASDDAVALRMRLLESIRKIADDIAAVKDPKGNVEQDEDTVALQRKLLRACLKAYEKQVIGPEQNVEDRVREFYLSQPKEIAREASEREDALVLQAAAQRCRVVPGAVAELVKDKKGGRINPVEKLRRLRTYHLLDWLAQRTVNDHWFEPDGSGKTFYRPAARAYLVSAGSLLDPKSALRKENEDKKARLSDAGLIVANVLNRYWTTEQIFPLKWPIQAGKDVPQGTPMVWLEITKGSKKAVPWQLKDPAPINPWVSLDAAAAFQLRYEDFLDNTNATVVFHALYRGQHVRNEVKIERPPPDVIVRHTLGPEKVGFAVRMEKALDYGAIAIVLDNSGSMDYVYPAKTPADIGRKADKSQKEDSRFDYALKAIKQVLEKIPNGTNLSIIAFAGKQVTEPVFVEPPGQWQKGRIDDVLVKLENMSRNNDSPIAKALIKAMDEGLPRNFPGPKVVIALTDGMDNSSYDRGDPANNTAGVITELRKANRLHPKVDLVIVGFIDDQDKEFGPAKAQFEHVKNFTDRSGFFPQAKGAGLGKTIEELIIRPYVQLKNGKNVVRGFEYGRPVNYQSDKTLEWKPLVDANNYEAYILNAPRSGVELKMPPGNNLFAILKRKEGRTLQMERGILGQQPEIVAENYPRETKDGWLATLLQNHKTLATSNICQLVTLEKTKLEEDIRQTHPGFAWLELTPAKGTRLDQTLVWNNDWSLPAPAFRLKMRWPKDQCPSSTTWFWPEVRDRFMLNDSFLNCAASFRSPMRPTTIPTWSRASPGNAPRIDSSAPFFPAQKPVVAELKDYPDFATEHRYFLNAGRATAYFYGLPTTLKEINLALVNIDAFKAAATKVEFSPERDRDFEAPAIFSVENK